MAPNDEEWLKFFHILSDLPFSSRKFNICRSSILGSNFIFHWFRVCWCRTSLEKRKIKFEPRVRFYNIRLERKAREIKPWKFLHRTLHHDSEFPSVVVQAWSRLRKSLKSLRQLPIDNFLSQRALAGHHGTNVKHLLPSTPRETLKRKEGRHAFLPPPPSPLFRWLNVQQGPTVRASTFKVR